jgi:hypothetical protein
MKAKIKKEVFELLEQKYGKSDVTIDSSTCWSMAKNNHFFSLSGQLTAFEAMARYQMNDLLVTERFRFYP